MLRDCLATAFSRACATLSSTGRVMGRGGSAAAGFEAMAAATAASRLPSRASSFTGALGSFWGILGDGSRAIFSMAATRLDEGRSAGPDASTAGAGCASLDVSVEATALDVSLVPALEVSPGAEPFPAADESLFPDADVSAEATALLDTEPLAEASTDAELLPESATAAALPAVLVLPDAGDSLFATTGAALRGGGGGALGDGSEASSSRISRARSPLPLTASVSVRTLRADSGWSNRWT